MNPIYCVFDGLDGSGKGLQLDLLRERLDRHGIHNGERVVFTREPGGTPLAEVIREVILGPLAKESTPFNNMLLFLAAREELMRKLVFPAILAGKSVISDRGDSSTFAFQIYGEERFALEERFWRLREDIFRHSPLRSNGPDIYVFFDLPPLVAYQRMAGDSARTKTHFDLRPIEYHERVRDGFSDFARQCSTAVIVDANRKPEEVHEEVWSIVSEELGLA
ncbi:MAG: dTMP kinase [Candidatus Paceibacterota bacterium]|jgi:dTMP kinase